MDSALAACLPRLGWMPLNIRDLYKKTAGLDPIRTDEYILQKVERMLEKHCHFHIRAVKAARARWHLPGASIDDSRASAASAEKLRNKALPFVQQWIANAQKRRDHAAKAARARWDKKRPAASIAEAGLNFASFPPPYHPLGKYRELLRDISPLTPLATRGNPSFLLETANTAPGAFAGLFDKGNPAEMPGVSVAGHQSSFLGGVKRLVKRRSQDPRYESFKAEVLYCWSRMNPDTPECPWIRKEEKALAELMEGNPNLDLEGLRRWLISRCHSEINPTDPPRKWLGNLVEYANGPLDRFKKPTGRRL